MNTDPLVVVTGDDACRAAAEALAAELGLNLGPHPEAVMALHVGETGLSLRVLRGEANLRGGKPITAQMPVGASIGQPLAKALGIKRRRHAQALRVLDATAGLGEDSLLMAALGCRVTAIERHPVVFALLRDALVRAGGAVQVMRADARHALERGVSAEVIYLDPMFPAERKTIGRKPMRALRLLVGDDPDAGELLEVALRCATRRVVVKRPRRAPPLSGEPDLCCVGRGLRYDVYLAARRDESRAGLDLPSS